MSRAFLSATPSTCSNYFLIKSNLLWANSKVPTLWNATLNTATFSRHYKGNGKTLKPGRKTLCKAGPTEGLKIRGCQYYIFGGHNLTPLVEIGLTDLPKSGEAIVPPGTTPLL